MAIATKENLLSSMLIIIPVTATLKKGIYTYTQIYHEINVRSKINTEFHWIQ